MKKIIDFTECKYVSELFEQTIKAMEFPSWCGLNLDALWDMLKGENETIVEFVGVESLKGDLQEIALEIYKVFENAEREKRIKLI